MATFSSARELLGQVLAHYRALDRYADEGVVRFTGRLAWAPPVRFESSFDAASTDFRFGFERAHPHRPLRHLVTRTEVGQQAGQPFFRTTRADHAPQSQAPESLELAIAGATGISRGAAFHIWQLLFDGPRGNFLQTLARPRLRRYSAVDGVRCHRVVGRRAHGGRFELHIGIDDLLVRAIVRHWRDHVSIEERRPVSR